VTRIRCVLADNPGPFTLEGTNTWIVGDRPAVVIDPGPEDLAHLARVVREAGPVAAILLTHHHPDHAPGAAALAGLTGAPVRAFRPTEGEGQLEDGDAIDAGRDRLVAVSAPGHSEDHVVFHLPVSGALFTGDAVLGRGTSVIDPPGGDLAAYLRSLERMRDLSPVILYPGHGPVVPDAMAKLDEYLAHRRWRERQVLEAVRSGPQALAELVTRIYSAYPPELHPAAARSVLAHLIKLEAEGRVVKAGGPNGERFAISRASRPPKDVEAPRPADPPAPG
jgi:glyoxylase-like metal-dependent hydrolase (beta-lactamase superfamily II)